MVVFSWVKSTNRKSKPNYLRIMILKKQLICRRSNVPLLALICAYACFWSFLTSYRIKTCLLGTLNWCCLCNLQNIYAIFCSTTTLYFYGKKVGRYLNIYRPDICNCITLLKSLAIIDWVVFFSRSSFR